MIALGLPRNHEIPTNSNPNWYDLGMCGPQRIDLQNRDEYCGRFRTPSLRDVAIRRSFFHNGVLHTLKEAVGFYAQRDTHPEKSYPRDRSGVLRKFNNLPDKYHRNVETGTPFGGAEGSTPPLDDAAIDDVIAFLKTLTDGYRQEH
jgi:cytochrome c peroxidase